MIHMELLWRLAVLLINVGCLTILSHHYFLYRKGWNEDRADHWFLLVMWSLASAAMQIENILDDDPIGFRLVLVTAASLITLKIIYPPRYYKS